MEDKVSEILENLLGLLGLEGSFEVEESEEGIFVSIETEEPGKLIGKGGETLSALQLLLNLAFSRQMGDVEEESGGGTKRIIVDISNWRKSKEEDLAHKARTWAQKVAETGQEMELEPMPSWQRRIIHMTVEGTEGVMSESVGEGADRHLIIRPEDTKK